MSDKYLTESEWKRFSKARKLKDDVFVKALAELEKAGKARDVAAQLKAFDEIEKQADALRRANKADKELASWFDDLDKALVKERKLADAEARKAEAAQKQDAGDDEEESPALLTSKLIPLLRELKKGEAVLQTLIALAGKECVVLLSRKAISPARGKLLKDYLENPGGLKFVRGEAMWELNSVTFVVQSQAAGLARKLKAALLAQTENRYKVRVRGEDGETDDDGDPDEEQVEKEGEERAAPAGSAAPAPPQGQDPKTEAASGEAEALKFNTRLADLMPRIKEAIAAGKAEVKLKVAEAGLFARKKEFDAAHALLDEAEQLMQPAGAAPGATLAATAGAAPADSGGFVRMQRSRLAWVQTRQAVQGELARLEQSILTELKDAPHFAGIQRGVRRLDQVLTVLDEALVDTLDAALNAAEPGERSRLQGQARGQVQAYRDYVAGDPFVADLDSNPFTPIKIREIVTRSLSVLEKSLA